MKTLNHSKTLIKPILIAAGLGLAVAAPAWATELPDVVESRSAGNAAAGEPATDAAADPESVARADGAQLHAGGGVLSCVVSQHSLGEGGLQEWSAARSSRAHQTKGRRTGSNGGVFTAPAKKLSRRSEERRISRRSSSP
jgi:hypothetical protein